MLEPDALAIVLNACAIADCYDLRIMQQLLARLEDVVPGAMSPVALHMLAR